MPVSISVVEDDSRYSRTLEQVLNCEPELRCISTHPNAEDALKKLPSLRPNIVLVDLELPKRSGIDLIRELKMICPTTSFLVLTQFDQHEKIFESLKAGGCGYLLKRMPLARICSAIVEAHAGGSPMSPEIARQVIAYFHRLPSKKVAEHHLSAREIELLTLVAEGARNKEIAAQLRISIDTARAHLRRIYEKLHVRSRTEAAVKFFSLGSK